MRRLSILFAVVFTAIAGTAFAEDHEAMDAHTMADAGMPHSVAAGELELSGAFTRAMPPNARTGGGFVTIANHGDSADRLVRASSPASELVQVHDMRMEDGVMVMRELTEGLEIPAGETVSLAPGGQHLMFVDVHEGFKEGMPVEVTLVFEKAGEVTLSLPVAPLGASEMPMDHSGH